MVIMTLSRVVSEIFNVEKMSWPWNPGQRSPKMIPFNPAPLTSY